MRRASYLCSDILDGVAFIDAIIVIFVLRAAHIEHRVILVIILIILTHNQSANHSLRALQLHCTLTSS